jgi:hypothetical protein
MSYETENSNKINYDIVVPSAKKANIKDRLNALKMKK